MESAPVCFALQAHQGSLWLVQLGVYIKRPFAWILQDRIKGNWFHWKDWVNDWVFDLFNYANNFNYENLLSSWGKATEHPVLWVLLANDRDIIDSQHIYSLPVLVLLKLIGQWRWGWRIRLKTSRAQSSCKTCARSLVGHARAQQTLLSPA